MCLGGKSKSPAPLPPAEPIEKPDVAPEPEAPKVVKQRSNDEYQEPAQSGTSALRVNLNLPSATGVNTPN